MAPRNWKKSGVLCRGGNLNVNVTKSALHGFIMEECGCRISCSKLKMERTKNTEYFSGVHSEYKGLKCKVCES